MKNPLESSKPVRNPVYRINDGTPQVFLYEFQETHTMGIVSTKTVYMGTQSIFAAPISEVHIIVPGLKTVQTFAMCIVTPETGLGHQQLFNQLEPLPLLLVLPGTTNRRNKMMKMIFKWKHRRCTTIDHKSINTLALRIMVAVSITH